MALHTTTLTAIQIELYLHTVLAQHPSYLPSAPSAQHAALTPICSLATRIDYHFTHPPKPTFHLIRPNRYLLHLSNNTPASLLVCQPSRPPITPDHPLHKMPPTPPPPSQHVSPLKHLPILLPTHRQKTFPLSLPSPSLPRTILNCNSHTSILSHSSSTLKTRCNASRACKIDAPATSTVKDRTTNGRPRALTSAYINVAGPRSRTRPQHSALTVYHGSSSAYRFTTKPDHELSRLNCKESATWGSVPRGARKWIFKKKNLLATVQPQILNQSTSKPIITAWLSVSQRCCAANYLPCCDEWNVFIG